MVNEQNIKIDIAKNKYEELLASGSPKNGETWQQSIDYSEKNSSEVIAEIKAEAIAVLKNEIQNDPMQLGYAGKTNNEIADLFNKPFFKNEIREVHNQSVTFPQAFDVLFKDYILLPNSQLIKPDGTVLSTTAATNEIKDVAAVAVTKVKPGGLETKTLAIEKSARINEVFKNVRYAANSIMANDVAEAMQ